MSRPSNFKPTNLNQPNFKPTIINPTPTIINPTPTIINPTPTTLQPSKVILFTNARDEPNLKEWIAHHLLLGFDFIYIFDHKSKTPLKGNFSGFNKDKFQVHVERCELNGAIKDTLITAAARISKKHNYDWMLYLDADEFFVINNNNITNVKQLLSYYPYADSISFNWLLFGTNYHINEPAGLIMDNYTRSQPTLNDHLKTFLRPNEFLSPNAHRSDIKNSNKIYHGNGTLLSAVYPPFKSNKHYINPIKFEKSQAFIAHYYVQSEETYNKRKLNLPRDDWGSFRDKKLTLLGVPITDNYNIHSEFNDTINTMVKDKYSQKIKDFLANIEAKKW